MSDHSIGFGEETIVDIRESKPELTMPQSIMVYWKVEYFPLKKMVEMDVPP